MLRELSTQVSAEIRAARELVESTRALGPMAVLLVVCAFLVWEKTAIFAPRGDEAPCSGPAIVVGLFSRSHPPLRLSRR